MVDVPRVILTHVDGNQSRHTFFFLRAVNSSALGCRLPLRKKAVRVRGAPIVVKTLGDARSLFWAPPRGFFGFLGEPPRRVWAVSTEKRKRKNAKKNSFAFAFGAGAAGAKTKELKKGGEIEQCREMPKTIFLRCPVVHCICPAPCEQHSAREREERHTDELIRRRSVS